MKKIKFSHNYTKLRMIGNEVYPENSAVLVCVFEVNLKDLSKIFIDYDTEYYDGKTLQHYPLKSGRYLLLIFKDVYKTLFTTLRPAFPQRKIDYYKKSIGEEFGIIITEKSKGTLEELKLQCK